MEFRQATQHDIEYMANHSINTSVDRKVCGITEQVFTIEHDGTPLAVGGFRFIVPTTAWCWIDLGDEAGKHLVTLYRTIRDWIDKFAENNGVKRLQAFVRTDSIKAQRFIEHLGFERESTMVGFFGDSNADMYVRMI